MSDVIKFLALVTSFIGAIAFYVLVVVWLTLFFINHTIIIPDLVIYSVLALLSIAGAFSIWRHVCRNEGGLDFVDLVFAPFAGPTIAAICLGGVICAPIIGWALYSERLYPPNRRREFKKKKILIRCGK